MKLLSLDGERGFGIRHWRGMKPLSLDGRGVGQRVKALLPKADNKLRAPAFVRGRSAPAAPPPLSKPLPHEGERGFGIRHWRGMKALSLDGRGVGQRVKALLPKADNKLRAPAFVRGSSAPAAPPPLSKPLPHEGERGFGIRHWRGMKPLSLDGRGVGERVKALLPKADNKLRAPEFVRGRSAPAAPPPLSKSLPSRRGERLWDPALAGHEAPLPRWERGWGEGESPAAEGRQQTARTGICAREIGACGAAPSLQTSPPRRGEASEHQRGQVAAIASLPGTP